MTYRRAAVNLAIAGAGAWVVDRFFGAFETADGATIVVLLWWHVLNLVEKWRSEDRARAVFANWTVTVERAIEARAKEESGD